MFMKKNLYQFALLATVVLFLSSCRKQLIDEAVFSKSSKNDNSTTLRSSSDNMAMGNPSGAIADPYYYWNYLMVKMQYTMSYHRDRGTPNWVSWHLDPTWLGSTPRQDNFSADATLPSGWYRVQGTSYSGSGF